MGRRFKIGDCSSDMLIRQRAFQRLAAIVARRDRLLKEQERQEKKTSKKQEKRRRRKQKRLEKLERHKQGLPPLSHAPRLHKRPHKKHRKHLTPKEAYREYLCSPHWQKVRCKFLETHKHCYLCGTTKRLSVHHKTYKRRGRERMTDLLCLCWPCHKKVHEYLDANKGKNTGVTLWNAADKLKCLDNTPKT